MCAKACQAFGTVPRFFKILRPKGECPVNRFKFWSLMTLVALTACFIVFVTWSDRKRAETMVAVKPTPEMVFHDRLAKAQHSAGVVSPASELQPALDTITHWAALFQRKKLEVDGDEWSAVLDLWQAADGWESLSPADSARIIAFLDQHRVFMDALRATSAIGGPTLAIPLELSDIDWREHLKAMRDSARLIALDAVVRAHTGEPETALADCIAGMQLYTALAPEPSYMSQLTRFSMAQIIYKRLQEAFPPGSLSDSQIARIAGQVRADTGKQGLLIGLQEDHLGWINEGVAPLVEGGWFTRYKRMQDWMAGDYSLSTRASLVAYSSPLAKPWVNRDMETLVKIQEHTCEMARLPYFQARPLIAQFNSDLLSDRFSPLAGHYVAMVSLSPLESQADHEVRLQLLQIGLSLERYQSEHGTLPIDLKVLSSTLPENTFIDPYTGNPFFYMPEGNKFLLYSVGRNLANDGGRHDISTGDFVWRGKEVSILNAKDQ